MRDVYVYRVEVHVMTIDQEENQVEKELRDLGHDPTVSTSPVHRTVTVPNPDEHRRLRPFEIYKYADRSDVYLMIVGSIAGSFSLQRVVQCSHPLLSL